MGVSRGSGLIAAAVTVLFVAGPPVEASAGDVTIDLRPTGPRSVSQGASFGFEAILHNSGPEAVVLNLLLDIAGPGDADRVAFLGSRPSVPAGGTFTASEEVTSSQWFAELGRYEILARLDGAPADRLVFEVTAPTVTVPVFEDVTEEAGLRTVTSGSHCGGYAAGAAWGDVEGDGDLDLYVPERIQPSQLWINDGTGRFTDQASQRGVDNGGSKAVGSVFADYDNDGDQDLYVANDGPNRLYRNDGTGRFEDVAEAAGVAVPTTDVSASWGDYDGDGFLDLYVVSYNTCAPPDFYQPDRLFHNEGDGSFTDRTGLLPEEATLGAGFEAAWWDYDEDGDQDLYLANDDWGPDPDANRLWRNDGPAGAGGWRFTDVSSESGMGYLINSMGIGIGDFDRDLDLDMAISNIGPTIVARNDGDGTFTEVGKTLGVDRPTQKAGVASVTWGLVFTDLNNDGWEDLFVAAGNLADAPTQPDALFVNDPAGRFLDLSALSGLDDPRSGRGVAMADYDRDGLVDLYVVQKGGSPRLYHNVTQTSGAHWLEVDLTGSSSNRDACGARLILTVDGARLLRQVFCGSISLSSGNDTVVHFGLGSDSEPSRLVIEWPSGLRQVIDRPAVDRVLSITEP
jgi:enediyne biosynthesis protein E4